MIKQIEDTICYPRPVKMKAIQMTQELRSNLALAPKWLKQFIEHEPIGSRGSIYPSKGVYSDGTDELVLVTNEGNHEKIEFGHWIIFHPNLNRIAVASEDEFDAAFTWDSP